MFWPVLTVGEEEAVWADKARFYSVHNHGGRVVDSELLHDVFTMSVHRVSAEKKQLGNLNICLSFRYVCQNFYFPFRE